MSCRNGRCCDVFFFCKSWLQVMPYLMHLSEVWYQFAKFQLQDLSFDLHKGGIDMWENCWRSSQGRKCFFIFRKIGQFLWLPICDYKSFTRMVLNRQGHNWEESRINAEDLIVLPDKTADYWQDGSKKWFFTWWKSQWFSFLLHETREPCRCKQCQTLLEHTLVQTS